MVPAVFSSACKDEWIARLKVTVMFITRSPPSHVTAPIAIQSHVMNVEDT
jgi:hypothetical protein